MLVPASYCELGLSCVVCEYNSKLYLISYLLQVFQTQLLGQYWVLVHLVLLQLKSFLVSMVYTCTTIFDFSSLSPPSLPTFLSLPPSLLLSSLLPPPPSLPLFSSLLPSSPLSPSLPFFLPPPLSPILQAALLQWTSVACPAVDSCCCSQLVHSAMAFSPT